jgi:myo-inositol 2-dehydrogenase/D-chiro-inositol 1-dehydrogenase
MTSTVSFGIVGFGRFGKVHAETILKAPGLEITSVCTGSEASLMRAREICPSANLYLDYPSFLRDSNVDVVDIVTPNFLHARQAQLAISTGRAVFLEKPAAISIEEGKKIVEAQQKSNVKVQVGFELRYSPFWVRVKELVDGERLGKLRFGRIDSWRSPLRSGSSGWRYDKARVGHQLLEEAIHLVDLAHWLFASYSIPRRVWCTAQPDDSWTSGVFSTAVMLIDFEDGGRFLITDNLNGFGSDVSVSLTGTHGALLGHVMSGYEPWFQGESWIQFKDSQDRVSHEKIADVDEVSIEIRDFARCIRENEEPKITIKDGYSGLSTCMSAIQSIRSKKYEPIDRLPS